MFNKDFAEKIFFILLTFPEIKKTCILRFLRIFYPDLRQKMAYERIDFEYMAGNITIGTGKTNWCKYYLNPTGIRFFHALLKQKYETEEKIKTSILLHILFLRPDGLSQKNLDTIYYRCQPKILFTSDCLSIVLANQVAQQNIKEEGTKLFLTQSGLEYLQKLG